MRCKLLGVEVEIGNICPALRNIKRKIQLL